MIKLRQLALGLGLINWCLLASCGGNNIEMGGATATNPPAAAAQPAGGDSIHTFSVDDFQQLSIAKSMLGPLEATNGVDLRVVARSTKDYSPENAVFAQAVAKRLEILLNTQVFHDLVVSQTYNSSWDNGMNPEQVYERLMQGKEPGRYNIEDGVIDLQLQQKDSCIAGKLGYRWSKSPVIYTYKCYIDRTRKPGLTDLTLAELGGHYIHEHLHILGFGHSEANPEQNSVPYRIGNLVRLLAENGVIVSGVIQGDLTFKTNKIYYGEYQNFKLYESSYAARALKLVPNLARYRGKSVKIRFQVFDNQAIYGAEIVN